MAASLLVGGRTLHSCFYVPIGVKDDTPSRMAFQHQAAKNIRQRGLLLVDEASQSSQTVYRFILRVIRDVYEGREVARRLIRILQSDLFSRLTFLSSPV